LCTSNPIVARKVPHRLELVRIYSQSFLSAYSGELVSAVAKTLAGIEVIQMPAHQDTCSNLKDILTQAYAQCCSNKGGVNNHNLVILQMHSRLIDNTGR
jgi:hypothetical protein